MSELEQTLTSDYVDHAIGTDIVSRFEQWDADHKRTFIYTEVRGRVSIKHFIVTFMCHSRWRTTRVGNDCAAAGACCDTGSARTVRNAKRSLAHPLPECLPHEDGFATSLSIGIFVVSASNSRLAVWFFSSSAGLGRRGLEENEALLTSGESSWPASSCTPVDTFRLRDFDKTGGSSARICNST
jgi:hypothetical protein